MPRAKAPNEIDVHVGSRVRMRRQFMNMRQGKLGDALGVTFQQVQKYEKGTNRISASRLQQASQILQMPIWWFFEGGPSPDRAPIRGPIADPPDLLVDFLATAEGSALMRAFSKIKDPKVRRKVVHLVKALADD